jgi:hypothetical protein
MQFTQVLGFAAVASVASAAFSNVTSTAVVYDNTTTVITVTSCEENKCSEVPITTGLTVVTKTIEGVVTEYTTYCPLTTEEETSTETAKVTSTVAPTKNETTTAEVSTFEGAAAKAVPAIAAVAAGVALLF